MKMKHTKGRHVVDHGNTLFSQDGRCIGMAYGWTGDSHKVQCEASEEAKANAVLWSSAPALVDLLVEYLDPVLPSGFQSEREWKIDFDTRVRCALLRLAAPYAASLQENVARAA